MASLPEFQAGVALEDPSAHELIDFIVWRELPDAAVVRKAIDAQPVPADLDVELLSCGINHAVYDVAGVATGKALRPS